MLESVVSGISSALTKFIAESTIGKLAFRKKRKKRSISLKGFYKGYSHQGNEKDTCYFKIKTHEDDTVSGVMTIIYANPLGFHPEQHFDIKGHFRYESYLTLEYYNSNPDYKQCGVLFLDYFSNLTLRGHSVGFFSPIPLNRQIQDSPTIARAEVFLSKQQIIVDSFMHRIKGIDAIDM